ncbi:benzaldehyde dehydrogenase [Actinomycetota bacterium]|nr:benzaldehyde dehydrogenase [Actinomycetota bacterium]
MSTVTVAPFESQAYIGGRFRPGAATHQVTDKSTGAVIGQSVESSPADVDEAVATAVAAQPEWAATSSVERAALLRGFAQALEGRREEVLTSIVAETGGTREKAEDEFWAATNQLYNSASQAQDSAGAVLSPYKRGKLSLSRQVPLGVVGVIVPWNYPLSLAMRAVAPALTFGNTVVLKPAELTPGVGGQLIAEAVAAAGFPDGVLNVVPGLGSVAGAHLAQHPDVDLVHFTGSLRVGAQITQQALVTGAQTAIEVGGDNAFVVLDDADVETAATCGVWTSLWYQGQTCISAGRHIVHRAVADRYIEALVDRVRGVRLGDAHDPASDIGPLVSERQRDMVAGLQRASTDAGARVLTGGTWDGTYYQPTVLVDVTPDMPIFTEETFGPIIPVTVVDSVEEALALTNSQRMLMSSVFGGDLTRTYRFAEQVHAGEVHVNDGYARHGGENQAAGFTRRQWIGIQPDPATYSQWARRGA